MSKTRTQSEFIHAVMKAEAELRHAKRPLNQRELAEMWGVADVSISQYANFKTILPAWRYIEAQARYGWSNEQTMSLIQEDYPSERLEQIFSKLGESEEYRTVWERLSEEGIGHPFYLASSLDQLIRKKKDDINSFSSVIIAIRSLQPEDRHSILKAAVAIVRDNFNSQQLRRALITHAPIMVGRLIKHAEWAGQLPRQDIPSGENFTLRYYAENHDPYFKSVLNSDPGEVVDDGAKDLALTVIRIAELKLSYEDGWLPYALLVRDYFEAKGDLPEHIENVQEETSMGLKATSQWVNELDDSRVTINSVDELLKNYFNFIKG